MSEESIIAESYSNLKSAILLGRTDIVRGILSTAAESRFENGFFEDEEDEVDGEDFRIKKWDEDYDDNPYDILRVMLNYVDNDAGTALHLATKLGNADITRALLSAGADPTRLNKEGATPFEYCTDEKILRIYNEQLLEAAAHNQLTKLERLLNAGVSANAGDGTTTSNRALHWAASFGGHEAVRLLCEHGADTNATNSSGSTPLFDAVKRRDLEITKILLSYGARTDIPLTQGPNKGKTPLDLVSDGSEIKELLLSPPERIIPQRSCSEINGSLNEADLADQGSRSSLGSLGESKCDGNISNIEDIEKSSLREFDLSLLWPYPQQLTLIKGSRYFPEAYLSVRIFTKDDQDPYCIQDMWRALDESFKKLGFSIRMLLVSEASDYDYGAVPGCITCTISPLLFSKCESYSIHVSSHKISVYGSEARSLWYGINTLLQLFRLSKGIGIPQMQINDWPDLKYRAYLVDIGHGRTLNCESLFFLVDVLSHLKYNQLLLCLQNSFNFASHGDACKKYSWYNQSDILRLDRYCRKRYIELVPYMDHFSDFSQWLKHERYKYLAENASPQETSVSSECLSPENVETTGFVGDLNSQLCSSFPSSRFIHVGFSSVADIASGTPEQDKDKVGKKRSVLEHVRNVNDCCRKHKKMGMMWTNSFYNFLKQGNEIPGEVIAMVYCGKVYMNDDFGTFCKLCSDSGIPYYVCPSTMSWCSLIGPAKHNIDLIDESIQAAVHYNALGCLITDWSAYGHVNPLEVSMPGVCAGVALSWNSKMKQDSFTFSISKVLDVHVFYDEAGVIGQILQDLSEVHKILEPLPRNIHGEIQENVYPEDRPADASLLLQLLLFPDSVDLNCLDHDNVQKATRYLRKCQAALPQVQMKTNRASTIVKVLNLTIDMALYACRVGRALVLAKNSTKNAESSGSSAMSSLPSITRTDLANRLLGIIENHRRIWQLSKKPGGLEESIELLQRVFEETVPSSTLDV